MKTVVTSPSETPVPPDIEGLIVGWRLSLWLGRHATQPFGESRIGQMIAARGELAGVEGVHPHALRSTFAHHSLVGGMQEGDLMRAPSRGART